MKTIKYEIYFDGNELDPNSRVVKKGQMSGCDVKEFTYEIAKNFVRSLLETNGLDLESHGVTFIVVDDDYTDKFNRTGVYYSIWGATCKEDK